MYLHYRKFNTKTISKEYCDDNDFKKNYQNGEIKYLLKVAIIESSGSYDKMFQKHGINSFTDLVNRYNKIIYVK